MGRIASTSTNANALTGLPNTYQTAGIDKATAAMVETGVGIEVFLGQIRDRLKSGEFAPVEVRRVMIPKGNSGKFRKLGIPTIADRVVQASLKLVLEPIFEADFKPCWYGFRPNRRAHDAIAEIHHLASKPINYRWVSRRTSKPVSTKLDHTALMDRLRVRIKDKRTCALVKAFLKSGVMTELGDREETLTGTPQGGILSPLLANIALSALDDHFDQKWRQEMGTKWQRGRSAGSTGQGNYKIVRYAEQLCPDGVRVTGTTPRALREEVTAVLAPMGLRLAPEKTRVVHIDEGFDVPRLRPSAGCGNGEPSKHYVYTKPSRKAIQAIKDKVTARTYRSTRHHGSRRADPQA